MRLTYDPKCNVAYICFREAPEQVETLHISDELNVDLSPDGTVYGIELLNANEQLLSVEGGSIVILNESSGESKKIELAL